MGAATDVILSGGSAGGLAVFYNLDHLATQGALISNRNFALEDTIGIHAFAPLEALACV